MNFRSILSVPGIAAVGVLCLVRPAVAQWITQTNTLRAGWNAVYLHVDASHTDLSGLVGVADPIEEIWLWNPALPPGQSITAPQAPGGSQWSTWTRAEGPASPLQTLRGNSALLVRLNAATPSFEWKVKGKPVAPSYAWTLTGLNFIGFSTPAAAPSFESLLAADAQALDWGQDAQIFRYQGGALGATNPVLVAPVVYRNTPVRRDQAYWVRAGASYNQYFGPFQVSGPGPSTLRFGDSAGQTRLVLKNMTPGELTVRLRQVPSEEPPNGESPIFAPLPFLVRGPLITSNLTFSYSLLSTQQWTLAPKGEVGSETEIVLGLDRAQMTGAAGTEYAGVLRFSDSLGLSQVDIAASATAASRAGLWVGSASVDQVNQYLKSYTKVGDVDAFHARLNSRGLTVGVNNPSGTNVLPFAISPDARLRYEWDKNTGLVLVFGTDANNVVFRGSYLLDGPIQLDPAGVARPFPLRLIVHNDGTQARLLQRAYLGVGLQSNLVVATEEDFLMPSKLASARRVSAVHLPSNEGKTAWTLSGGALQEGDTLSTSPAITVANVDHSSNPFLHTYHPDHDNLDAGFKTERARGAESYDVERFISLRFEPPPDDFNSRTKSGANLNGIYMETVTFKGRSVPGRSEDDPAKKSFTVQGTFRLTRILDIATLTTTP